MAFISRLINKRIASFITRYSTPQMMGEEFKNDYPLEGTGDHHRFYL